MFIESDKISKKKNEDLIKVLIDAISELSKSDNGSKSIVSAIRNKDIKLDGIENKLIDLINAIKMREGKDTEELIAAIKEIRPSSGVDIERLIEEVKAGNAHIVSSLSGLLKAVADRPEPSKPKEWNFEIERDKFADKIIGIKARAIK